MPLDPRLARDPDDDHDVARHRAVTCRACGAEVTRPEHAIAVGAAGLHTFVNPAGAVFELRTFVEAAGCRAIGPATAQWTWFPGYAWRVALCGACGDHLGWQYVGNAGSFYGLIADTIVDDDG